MNVPNLLLVLLLVLCIGGIRVLYYLAGRNNDTW